MDRLNDLKHQLDGAKAHLGELNAVHDALGKAPETYLTVFDPRNGTGKPVLAAVAVGNPDTAQNVSVTVPGIGSTTQGSLPDMVTEASNLRLETERQLRNAGLPGSAATIAWMGYDPPPNPINTLSPADAFATMGDGQARLGADSLSSYLQQVHANNPNSHLTLLGHSYGSLTSSLALQELHAQGLHPVDDVVFYGSPGLELTSSDQLGLGAGHAYVMRGMDDPIAGSWRRWPHCTGGGSIHTTECSPNCRRRPGPIRVESSARAFIRTRITPDWEATTSCACPAITWLRSWLGCRTISSLRHRRRRPLRRRHPH